MKKGYIFIILALIFLFSLGSENIMAAPGDWTAWLTISTPSSTVPGGVVFNSLSAGVRNGATDGYDNATDTVSFLEPDDPVQAYFTHGATIRDTNGDGVLDGWDCTNPESGYSAQQCTLWRDFRPLYQEKTWTIESISSIDGATISLNWRVDGDPADMTKIDLALIDLSAPSLQTPINLKLASSYQYTNVFVPGKKYGLRKFEIRMKVKGLFIYPLSLPDATTGMLYSVRLSAAGGTPVWSLENGNLPPGMSLNPSTGDLMGLPIAIGSYRFTVRGDDPASGYGSSRDYTLNINSMPEIGISNLPDGVLYNGYRVQIPVTGGSAPVIWETEGGLPEGIILNSLSGIISGTPIVPGIYNFTATVKDANGATDSKDFKITVIEPGDERPPEAIGDLRGIYATDTSILLTWSAPLDDSITRTAALYDLRYVEDCPAVVELSDSTWDRATEANGEPRPISGALHTYTLTGLKPGMAYCIAVKSMDASGHVSSISNIVAVSSERAVSANLSPSPVVLRKGYNLISLPLMPLPNERDPLFGPAVGTPVALYRWYSTYPGITLPQYYLEDTIMPGLGYFLYSPEDNLRMDIKGLEPLDAEYSVTLQYGWNMIGTPYDEVILLSDVLVKNGTAGEVKSYIDAVKAGWIGNALYQHKDGGYDFASFNDDLPATLEPWVGYWIYVGNKDGVEIIFRRP